MNQEGSSKRALRCMIRVGMRIADSPQPPQDPMRSWQDPTIDKFTDATESDERWNSKKEWGGGGSGWIPDNQAPNG